MLWLGADTATSVLDREINTEESCVKFLTRAHLNSSIQLAAYQLSKCLSREDGIMKQ